MKKKLMTFILPVMIVLSLAACSSRETPTTYTVGICQLEQHTALDAASQGFMDALNELLPGQITFDLQNASSDISECSAIVNQFVAADVDLIMANATPALQAASACTIEIPILGTSVTEYGVAMGISDFSGTVGGNVSGTSDLVPLDQQAAMLAEWFPDAESIGLLYCSAEANSRYQADVLEAELNNLGFTAVRYAFSGSKDLPAVTEEAAAASDVIYVPTDNAIAANTHIIDGICRSAKVPVIAGAESICGSCGVATTCVDYYDLGAATGKMAAKILTGEADISTMPVEYAPQFFKKYNPVLCDELGLTAPAGYAAIG